MGRLEEAHVAGVEAAKASVEMTSRKRGRALRALSELRPCL